MYFPVGWPKVLNLPETNCSIRQLVYNRDKILFVVLTEDAVLVYYCKPCLLIVIHQRDGDSVKDIGLNESVEWKPDSSALVVTTSFGCLLFYNVKIDSTVKGVYDLVDPPQHNLRRDSAELFVKEVIPSLQLELDKQVYVGAGITSLTCIRDELMVAVTTGHIYRYRWNGTKNLDYCADLRRVPFCVDQHVTKAVPIFEENTYITQIEYSPLNGGFAVVFNDGRASFLTATSLRFDPNQMQGIWAPIDDATCAAVNHKFRLITFGRKNSQGVVYNVDETTGGLVLSHQLTIPGQVYPGPIGPVHCMRWSPDSSVLALCWKSGGVSLWSTFGALLMCTLAWDYGLSVDLLTNNPLNISCVDWSAEGYQLWMVKASPDPDSVLHFNFVKSALTVNPCMSHQNHLYLQAEDKLYVSLGRGFTKDFRNIIDKSPSKTKLTDNKQWSVVQIPSAYSSTNWPIRYSAIDSDGSKLAVAGRAGLAHYSFISHRWKLFGNETQEKDMLVTGGLLWWRKYIVAGCYNIQQNQDELRFYPSQTRLSNIHMTMVRLSAQSLLLDQLHDHLLVFCADSRITIYAVCENDSQQTSGTVKLTQTQIIDLSGLGVHPACFVAITLFSLRTEASRTETARKDNFIINVSGRVLMVNLNEDNGTLEAPVGLASCVEHVWASSKFSEAKPHLTEALWLFCGAHGMRVWLPLFPRGGETTHTYMSKRIMLPFQLKVYPMAILFEDAVLLGVENDTVLYSSDSSCPFSLPFSVLERTSQVYLHQVLRQLIKRNLGFHAWEIARCCTSLPYFPHSLELLLHEVLEEEATSKEPIPDAQLPSIIEFIQEFPVYLDTVVQCARKTEIALWPYLFSVAGKPKDLFQKCLAAGNLETAASYLIILQNLEPSTVSRQYATMLLDSTLHSKNWELSKELVRFLKAIDPNDVEHTRASLSGPANYGIPQTPSVNNTEEDLSLVLGTSQVSRGRSFSTTVTPKIQNQEKSLMHRTSMTEIRNKVTGPDKKSGSAEEFFMDKMVERHARRLLYQHGLRELGRMAAVMDFPLVSWLAKERNRAAVVDNCVSALKNLHESFRWPYPSQVGVPEEEKEQSLECVGSQVGDSGYMSYPFNKETGRPIDEQSVASEVDSCLFEESEWAGLAWAELPPPVLLDRVLAKGSPKAEIQLRYLLQLLTDAGCLQWALVVAVLLGDAMAVHRVANAARSPDQTFESVARLRDDMAVLAHWAAVECPPYRPFSSALQPQISVLNRLLTAKQKTSLPTVAPPQDPPPPPPPSPPPPAQAIDHSNSCVLS